MKFSETDKKILESYKSILEGLSLYMGSGYEIVLHSLENLSSSAIKVFNGDYSGRKEGAPITDLALRMLEEIKKSGNPHTNMVYTNRNNQGVPIHSATLPIVGDHNNIIGLICINFYSNISLNKFFENIFNTSISSEQDETFVNDSDELIHTVISKAKSLVYSNPMVLSADKNKEIIHYLYEKNIFDLKNSIQIVSSSLGISKNTVYMHIRNIKKL